MKILKRLLIGLLALTCVVGGGGAIALTIGVPASFVPSMCGTPSAVSAIVCVQTGGNTATPWLAINPTTHQVEIAPPTSLLHATNNAALSGWSLPIIPLVIDRDGFYAPGDGGQARYAYSAAACSAPDNGAQVTGPNGGCWIGTIGSKPDLRVWGAKCDRVTDDAVPFNAAAAALSSLGGGELGFCRSGALIDSADAIVAPNVYLAGGFAAGGVRQGGDYTSAANTPYALVMNPAHTLRVGDQAGVHGIIELRKGLTPSTDYHSGFAQLAAYAGTGMIFGDASGNPKEAQSVSDVMILGFNLGLDTNNESRFKVRDVKLDDNNGIRTLGVYDVANFEHIEGWPFAITGSWNNPSRTIVGMANNGNGLVRVKVPLISSANPSQDSPPLVGEPIWVAGSVGVPGVNQEWTVAAVSSDANYTYVDLKGSAFSGAWTSGGNLISWTGRRPGVGFYEDNTTGFRQDDIFFYSYQTAFYFGPNTAGPKCGDCSFDDNSSLADPATIGINFNGQRGVFENLFASSVGQKFIYTSNSGDDTFLSFAPVISPNAGRSITVNQGSLTITGANIGGEVHMASGSTSLRLLGVNQGGGFNITGDSPSDLAKVSTTAGRAGSTLLKPASPFSSYPLTGATTLTSSQINQIIYATNGPWTLTLPDANTVPAGAMEAIVNNSSLSIITIGVQNSNGLDPDASAGIPAGGRLVLYSDGYGNWRTLSASWQQLLTMSAAPVPAQIPYNTCRPVANTNGTIALWCNNYGQMKSVTLN